MTENVQSIDSNPPIAQQSISDEKMLKQSEVDRLMAQAHREKKDAVEKARLDVLQQMQQQQPQPMPPQQQAPNYGQQQSSYITPEQIDARIQQQLMAQHQQMMANQVYNQFAQKMEEGAKHYPDFKETINSLPLNELAPIVHFATGFDNTADMMYDLAKNPSKAATLMNSIEKTPMLAPAVMKQWSDSIKQNQVAAATQPNIREPLSHMKPSPTGGDNGSKTVADLRRQPWLKA